MFTIITLYLAKVKFFFSFLFHLKIHAQNILDNVHALPLGNKTFSCRSH